MTQPQSSQSGVTVTLEQVSPEIQSSQSGLTVALEQQMQQTLASQSGLIVALRTFYTHISVTVTNCAGSLTATKGIDIL